MARGAAKCNLNTISRRQSPSVIAAMLSCTSEVHLHVT